MEKLYLLPGFRFHPTDVELVVYYLKRKIMGRGFSYEAIPEIDLYGFPPWDLPAMSSLNGKDLVWFFFCSLERKYATGQRAKRRTGDGFWKTTGKTKKISFENRVVGIRKSLVFHRGKAPHGDRTDWVMHEYSLEDKELIDASISQDAFVVCKIFKKSGPGPKNGEQYGAPFREEDWGDDGGGAVGKENDSFIPLPCAGTSSSSPGPGAERNESVILSVCDEQCDPKNGEQYEASFREDDWDGACGGVGNENYSSLHGPGADQNESVVSSVLESGIGHNSLVEPCLQQSVTMGVSEQHPSSVEHDDVLELLLNAVDDDVDISKTNGSGIDEVDSVIPSKITVKDVDTSEIFKELEGKELEDKIDSILQNSVEPDFNKYVEDEILRSPLPFGVVEASFLERKDLQDPMEIEGAFLEYKDLCDPMEAGRSKDGICDCLFRHHCIPVLPAVGAQARDSLGGNGECSDSKYGYSHL